MADTIQSGMRPMNVAVKQGSPAERSARLRAGVPGLHAEVIAPGFPATPSHNLQNFGGKTIPDLTFTNFYVGGTAAWNASDRQSIDHALAAAMSDTHLNNVMMQYFGEKPITTTFKPSAVLPGPKPSVFSQGDVEKLVSDLLGSGTLTGFDLTTTAFCFMLPSGCVLTTDTAPTRAQGAEISRNPAKPEDKASSLEGLGGYHGSVHAGSQTLYYAIGAYSEILPDGTENGIVAFDAPWKNVVATFYHELNEVRTDADVEDAINAGDDPSASHFLGWISKQGEECGDYPVFEAGANLELVMQEVPLTDGSGTVPVQFQYSNAVSGPEGPIAAHH